MMVLNIVEVCYSLFHHRADTRIIQGRLQSHFMMGCNEQQGKMKWDRAIMPGTALKRLSHSLCLIWISQRTSHMYKANSFWKGDKNGKNLGSIYLKKVQVLNRQG